MLNSLNNTIELQLLSISNWVDAGLYYDLCSLKMIPNRSNPPQFIAIFHLVYL